MSGVSPLLLNAISRTTLYIEHTSCKRNATPRRREPFPTPGAARVGHAEKASFPVLARVPRPAPPGPPGLRQNPLVLSPVSQHRPTPRSRGAGSRLHCARLYQVKRIVRMG